MEEPAENKKKKRSFRSLLHLWPAVLAGVMVVSMIPRTKPVLQDIPELLSIDALAASLVDDAPEEEPAAPETEETAAPAAIGDYDDGVYEGSAQGYGGLVTVRVTVQNRQIVSVEILEAAGETEPFFSRAQFVIDDVLASQTWDVDVISEATYSSRGILGAIQNALTGVVVVNEAAPSAEPAGTLTQLAFSEPAGGYADGTYTGSATGFGGPITVSVTISGGMITGISILSASGETDSYLASASAVIPRMLSAQSPNVDTVSGATYSSTGILNAVKAALASAGKEDTSVEETDDDGKETAPNTDAMPAQPLKDGVYTGTGEGFGGDITVQMTVSDGRITAVEVVSAEDETPSFLERAEGVIAGILNTQTAEVDVVSGATYSSNGILDAVKEAIGLAEAAQAEGTNTGDTEPGETGTGGTETGIPEQGETGTGGTETGIPEQGETGTEGTETGTPEEGETGTGGTEAGSSDTEGETEPDESETGTQDETAAKYADGTYTSVAVCTDEDIFNYQVKVTVVVENGCITSIQAEIIEDLSDDPDSNAVYFGYALNGRTRKNVWYEGILSQILTKQSAEEVDAVSGATYSSHAIGEASRLALGQAEAAVSAKKPEE